ncbi:hypothetical protein JCM10207_009297 [Rhodosporidiobolus poonsookiae]
MTRLTILLALATAALAAPAPSVSSTSTTIVDAFRTLRLAAALEKRQSMDTVIDGLEDLLDRGISSVQSGGQCSSQCTPWVGYLTDCVSEYTSYVDIGRCACGSDETASMEVCGNCFGSSSQTDATDFASYCRQYGIGGGSSSTTTSRASVASGTRAVSSTSPTVTSNGQGPDFGGLSDIASQTGSAGAAATSLRSGDMPTTGSSDSTSSNPLTGGGNGAGALKIGAGLAAGAAVGAVALLF